MATPMTSFGACEFQIVHEDTQLPVWEQEAYSVTRHVPGGSVNITQLLGLGPLVVTYTVECDDQAAYAALAAAVQTTATLRIPKTVAEDIGTEENLFGDIYTEYEDVTLMSLQSPVIALDQSITVQARFQMQERPS